MYTLKFRLYSFSPTAPSDASIAAATDFAATFISRQFIYALIPPPYSLCQQKQFFLTRVHSKQICGSHVSQFPKIPTHFRDKCGKF